jgi:putative MATE family efflux protein
VEQVQENKMGTKPMLPLILSMSLPAMFSMLVQALYNIVDSIFVSRLGVNALAAVSLAFPVQTLMISVGVGTGVGINSLISRRLGEHKYEEANKAATHGVFLGIFSWVPFLIFGLLFSEPFMRAFSSNEQVVEMGIDYLSIVTIFSLACLVEICCEKTLQATGNMIFPMLFQLSGAITNIILDPIFIFGLLGVPEMGVAGAAIATVLGQVVSLIFAIIILFCREHHVKIELKGFHFEWKTIRDIYAVGLPSIVMQAISSFLNMGLNGILAGFSDTAVAVLGAYYKLQSFIFMPAFGLNQGLMPIMGYNYGARKKERLLSAIKIGAVVMVGIMVIGLLIFQLFPDQLLNIFKEAGQASADAEMLRIGRPALRIISICFVPAAIGILFSTAFQATGMGMRSLIISLLRQMILLLPAAWLLSLTGEVTNVWFAFPIAEAVACVISILLFLDMYKKHIRTM